MTGSKHLVELEHLCIRMLRQIPCCRSIESVSIIPLDVPPSEPNWDVAIVPPLGREALASANWAISLLKVEYQLAA